MPRVTVLTTLYNKGPYVEEAVRSALASTFTDIEVLVVDDASTDDGPDRVAAIGDPRIRLVRSPVNTGRPAAANRGFAEARGEYIAILDADDLMHPERLAEQVAFLDAHPDIGVLGTALDVFGEREEEWVWPERDEEVRGRMLFSDPVCYPSVMLRRALLVEHHLRCDEDWRTPGMDFLFLISLAPHTRYANLRRPLTRYRVGAQNMRHGSDAYSVRERLYRRQFESMGLMVSDEEIRLQLMLHRLFKRPPDSRDARSLAQWVGRLKAANHERAFFPQRTFEQELDRRFNRLFHPFADASVQAGLAHLRLSRSWSWSNLRYLLAVGLRHGRAHAAADAG